MTGYFNWTLQRNPFKKLKNNIFISLEQLIFCSKQLNKHSGLKKTSKVFTLRTKKPFSTPKQSQPVTCLNEAKQIRVNCILTEME